MSNLDGYRFFFERKPISIRKRYKILFAVVAIYLLSAFIRIPVNSVKVGYFAGESIGYYHKTFEITNKSIYIEAFSNQDTLPNIHKTINGDFRALNFNVPIRLMFAIGHTFGHPDSHDQGGYILGFKLLGIPFEYNIDKGSEPWYFGNMTEIVEDRMLKVNVILNDQSS